MAVSTGKFYDDLAPLYHLIYQDWDASIARQARILDEVIQERFPGIQTILDAACGIGTQALGLAALGYEVSGSDLSSVSISRAGKEAKSRDLQVDFRVGDMRNLGAIWKQDFDVVLACDNAIPHLLSDAEILAALGELYKRVKPGGGCVISMRDYEHEERSGTQIKPYGVRQADGVRYLLWQVWEFSGDIYNVDFYFVEDRGGSQCKIHVMRDR
jgi:SAM-dependent methyltransferase